MRKKVAYQIRNEIIIHNVNHIRVLCETFFTDARNKKPDRKHFVFLVGLFLSSDIKSAFDNLKQKAFESGFSSLVITLVG